MRCIVLLEVFESALFQKFIYLQTTGNADFLFVYRNNCIIVIEHYLLPILLTVVTTSTQSNVNAMQFQE